AFQKFRGESWMPEPCRSCDRRTEDFGGCRCQALLLTGDASATDPACSLAPSHLVIELALLEVPIDTASAPPLGELIYRVNPMCAVIRPETNRSSMRSKPCSASPWKQTPKKAPRPPHLKVQLPATCVEARIAQAIGFAQTAVCP